MIATQPVFPQEFVKSHCPQVLEARRKQFDSPEDFAECDFNSAGCGLLCANCRLHLTRPFIGHKLDEEFLPRIEQYYREMKEHKMPELPRANEIIKGLSYLDSQASMLNTEVDVCAEHDVFYASLREDDYDTEKLDQIANTMEIFGWTRNDLNGNVSFEINV